MQPEPGLGLTGPEKTQLQCSRVQKAICWDPQGEAHPVVRVPGAAAVGTPGAHRSPGSRGQRCLSDPQMQTKPLATLPGLGSLHSGVKWAQNWEEMWSRFQGSPWQGMREKEPAKNTPEEKATGFTRPAGTSLECQGSHINCSRSWKLRRGGAPAGRGLGGPPPPRLEPNGHHSPQRFNGLITTSPQPDRAAGTRLANRLNVHPPHTAGTAVGTLQGHGPPPCPLAGQADTHQELPSGPGARPDIVPFLQGPKGGTRRQGASRCGRMGAALSSWAHLPFACLGPATPVKRSGHHAGRQLGSTRRPTAQPWPRAQRPLPGGGPPMGRELGTRPLKQGSGAARWLLTKPLARLPLTPGPSGGS